MANSTFVIIIIVIVVFIVISIFLALRRRLSNIPQSQQLQMTTRRNHPLQLRRDRRSAGIPNFVSQPTRPIPNAIRSPNTAIPPPFLSIVHPQEPPPIHSPIRSPTLAPNLTLDLVERMRQVQIMMIEIHRLENESTSGNHRQRIQELQQRVMALSDTAPDTTIGSHQTTSNLPPAETSDPPPAYDH